MKSGRARRRNRHYRSPWNGLFFETPFPYGTEKEEREVPIQERIDNGTAKYDQYGNVKKTVNLEHLQKEYE